jgi:sugar (pentulose or hexulose) kinase
LSGSHRRGHLYRALLEGIALEQALVTGMIEDATGRSVKELVAIGGGAASDLWCQIIADATGKSIQRSQTVEASSLGAAICAAVGAGLYADASDAAAAMSGGVVRQTQPSPENRGMYADLLGIYRELYPSLRGIFAKLARRTTC